MTCKEWYLETLEWKPGRFSLLGPALGGTSLRTSSASPKLPHGNSWNSSLQGFLSPSDPFRLRLPRMRAPWIRFIRWSPWLVAALFACFPLQADALDANFFRAATPLLAR